MIDLFLANIPRDLSNHPDDIAFIMSWFDTDQSGIESIRVIMDRECDYRFNKGYCFVRVKSMEVAKRAIYYLNECPYEGQQLHCSIALPKQSPSGRIF